MGTKFPTIFTSLLSSHIAHTLDTAGVMLEVPFFLAALDLRYHVVNANVDISHHLRLGAIFLLFFFR